MIRSTLVLALASSAVAAQDPLAADRFEEGTALPKSLTPAEQASVLLNPIFAAESAGAPIGSVRTPAEYEPMEGILVAYEGSASWRTILRQMAVQVTTVGNANMYVVCDSASEASSTFTLMVNEGADPDRVITFVRRTDSIWMRDYGPRYIYEEGIRAMVDHTYNRPRPNDNAFSAGWAPARGEAIYDIPLVHGGGNYHLDALGGAASTRLINNENPSLTQSEILQLWRDFQSLETTLFDAFPTFVDSTQHIDMWMQIAGDDQIVISDWPLEPGSQWDQICDQAAADFAANGWTVTRVPALRSGGTHYTFTNVVMVNDLVLIPEYDNVPATYSQQALAAWQADFPNKNIVQIDCDGIVTAAGVMHCIVMHVPASSGGENPVVWVTEPAADADLDPGDTLSITWKTDDDAGAMSAASVDIHLVDSGGAEIAVIAEGVADSGSFVWSVPDVAADGASIEIVARDADGNVGTDTATGLVSVSGAAGCSPADLAAPFGFLDLTDIDTFIGAFGTGDLAADLAVPFGVVDLSDIDAFIAGFLAGCP
ncbi:MAG: agmatine deiminase family protein [Planctomycetota bacterium]